MKVLIVDDEALARNSLARILSEGFPQIEIAGMTNSVKSTVEWLEDHDRGADLIFMDIELLDGSCFEIFRQVEIKAKVVMSTAFDKYAVKAFEEGAIDYILKPYESSAVKRAVLRCLSYSEKNNVTLEKTILNIVRQERCLPYKKRFIVKVGPKIIPVEVSDIAYIDAEGMSKYIVTGNGSRYLLDITMDSLLEQLDPKQFFQISRACIIAVSSIGEICRIEGGRVKIKLKTKNNDEVVVSRARVPDFLAWFQ